MDQAHALTLPDPRTGATMNRPESHEGLIARHLAQRAVMIAPVIVAVVGLVRGLDGALSAAIGLLIVAANFLVAAKILSWAVTKSVGAIYGAIFGGFFVRLAVLLGIVLALEPVSFIDVPVLVLTVAVAHLALLMWETRSVSLTLAAPGLKPGIGEPSKDKE